MKILFFGSSHYCLPIIKKLHELKWLSAIITKPGGKIAEFARENQITDFTVSSPSELIGLKGKLNSQNPDLAIVADFGLIIPPQIFNIPKFKTLNIHFSKLPDLRGASPVQYTILKGDKSAWVSVIVMNQGMDTGDIIWQKLVLQGDLLQDYTSQDLYQKLFNIISDSLPNIINKYAQGNLKPQKQDHSKATYTRILKREDGFIPWELILLALKNQKPNQHQVSKWPVSKILPAQFCILHFAFCIRQALLAFTPWPGLWTEVNIKGQKKRLKILKVKLDPSAYCLVPDIVQLEGKTPVTWKQFLEGYQSIIPA